MVFQRPLTIEDICNKLRPVFGEKIDNVYLKYAMAEGRAEKEEIATILYALYRKHLSELLDKKVLLEPPKKELMDGDYRLGTISYADKKLHDFNLREKDWVRHVCVSGMSGSGKTTFGFHVLENFLKHNKPFLVFDWKKSFRPLITADSEIMTFTVGDDRVTNLFKLNINHPPKDVAPKEWINVLCDLLTESFSVSFGVHKVLLETLDQAFKEWGIYNGSDNYPTWNHIKWRLEKKMKEAGGREATWLESAIRIASVLTFGSFGKIVNYKGNDSMNVADLLDKKIVFELNALGTIEKKFFCEFILTYIFKLKKAKQNIAANEFGYAILVDEAHNIFLKGDTNFAKESVTDMVYREMREYGVSLICLDQHISKLSDTVKGNSACHIAFQQQLPQDIQDISSIMQLYDKREYFSQLPVGTAIVKLSERHTSPFLVQVDPAILRNEKVIDKDLISRMQTMLVQREIEQGKDEEFHEKIKKPGKTFEEHLDDVVSEGEKKQEQIEQIEIKETETVEIETKQKVKVEPKAKVEPNLDNEAVDEDLNKERAKMQKKLLPRDKKPRIPKQALYDGELETVPKLVANVKEYMQRPLDEIRLERGMEISEKSIKDQLKENLAKNKQKTAEIREIIPEKPVIEIEVEEGIFEEVPKSDIKDDPVNVLKEKLESYENLTPSQEILYAFIELKLGKGFSLVNCERIMESNLHDGLFSRADIEKVINCNLIRKFNSKHGLRKPKNSSNGLNKQGTESASGVVTLREEQNQKVYKEKNVSESIVKKQTQSQEGLTEAQEMFLSFLQKNPQHEFSSVEFYKQVGLSARKGTMVKKQLLEQNKVREEEIKYAKGWKKIIRLA